jgi:hypothetical protein
MEDLMKSLLFVPLFFFVSVVVSAQDRGMIECQDQKSVLALEAPGSHMVARHLSCGQTVIIVGLERGYVKIQMTENALGYVEAKYVRSLGGQSNSTDRRVTELEAQVEALKQQSMPVQAQTTTRMERRPSLPELPLNHRSDTRTRFDIGGMFIWTRSFEDKSDYFGWNASFGGNITKHFGLEANISGNYWNSPVSFIGSSYHGFAGGPRFSFPAGRVVPNIHFLVGLTHGNGNAFGYTASANFLTLMPGFGLDANINRHFGIRVIQADYPVLRGVGAWSYENLRIGGGIVARF